MAAGKVRLTGTSIEFHVRHFTAKEALGSPFTYELNLLTMKRGVKVPELIGQQWTVELDLPKDKKRYFNGHVTNVLSTGPIGRFASYHVTLRPTLWFLSLTSNCRIFPKMSVLDIVRELTDKRGVELDDNIAHLAGTYPSHRYVVQYRESELDFLSRLMEHEGLYYFFKHEDGKHTMMLADGPGSHLAAPGYGEVPFFHASRANDADHIDQWIYGASAQTKKRALNDYDFKKPDADIAVKLEAAPSGEFDPSELEQYDFPGAFFDAEQGQNLVAVRQQEALANAEVARGAGTVRGLSPGYFFKLVDSDQDQDGQYLVTHASYECSPGDYASGDAGDEPFFRCSFAAIKKETPYRPPRVTPRPVINGLHSAKVIGPKGKEIWTDEQGRIRIRFHWQRPEEDAAREESSAIWVRVAQVMAGKGWGALQIPRIGHEVIVSFLEGDPDRPIVTGCVYNEANKPPFNPSGGGMVLGMKSDSTPGGGGYNEFSLDDTKGKEKINIHGQYDMTTTIEHDETHTIKNNRTVAVTVNHTESVGGDQSVSVTLNQTNQVGINQTEVIGSNQSVTVGANHTLTVGQASAETVALAKALNVGAGYAINVGAGMNTLVVGAVSEEVGAAKAIGVIGASTERVGQGKSITAGKDVSVKAGAEMTLESVKQMALHAKADLQLKGDKKGVIEIADQLTIKVGSASIIMKKNGDISISGNKINIKGDGNTAFKGSKIGNN